MPTLSEICEINPPANFNFELDDDCSFVPMEAIDEASAAITTSDRRAFGAVRRGYTPFLENDVLIAKITPCMENGKCAIARRLRNGIGFGSTEFHVLRASKEVMPEWLFYFWRLPKTRELAALNMTGSAGQKRVPEEFLESLEIPVPVIPEQRRITAQLDKADRLRQVRRYALELSDSFHVAAFLEIFGDPVSNPRAWQRARVHELGEVQTGNTPPREQKAYYGNTLEWIKSDNITNNGLYPTKATEMLSESGVLRGTTVCPGSLLVTCIAGSAKSIGNVVITDRRVAFNQQINSITPHGDVVPLFLYALLLTAKSLIQRNSTQAMKRMITKSRLEDLVLIKPPEFLQKKFAVLVERVERMRALQREALRQAEHLFQSLLHGAFRTEPEGHSESKAHHG